MSNTQKTLFPFTVYDDYFRHASFFDHRLQHVADCIFIDRMSPYLAWTIALNIDQNKIPDMVGLTEHQCKTFLYNSRISPPPLTILKFCLGMKIHPAHLVPELNAKNSFYPPSIVVAIAELLKEKKKKEVLALLEGRDLSDIDRNICIEAFRSEAERFNEICKEHYPKRTTIDYCLEEFAKKEIDPDCLEEFSVVFARNARGHRNDVDAALDRQINFLNDSKRNHLYSYAEHRDSLDQWKGPLSYFAEILYGDEQAHACVKTIIKILDRSLYTRELEDNFWEKGRNEIFDMSIREADRDSVPYYPVLHPNYKKRCLDAHLNPEDAKGTFLDILKQHIDDRIHLNEHSKKLENCSNGLEIFHSRISDPFFQDFFIPQYKNYQVIKPFLDAEDKRLSSEVFAKNHLHGLRPQP